MYISHSSCDPHSYEAVEYADPLNHPPFQEDVHKGTAGGFWETPFATGSRKRVMMGGTNGLFYGYMSTMEYCVDLG